MKGKVYIAGPMTGMPMNNRIAFESASALLKVNRYRFSEVVNPFDIIYKHASDRNLSFYQTEFEYLSADKKAYEACIKDEMDALATCTAIYLLRGWENSVGARRELAYALEHDMEVVLENGAMA